MEAVRKVEAHLDKLWLTRRGRVVFHFYMFIFVMLEVLLLVSALNALIG